MVARDGDIVVDNACTYAHKLQQLYTTISNAFPEDRALWDALADEQARHLQWLQQIKAQCASNALTLDASRIHVKAIESALPYMEVIRQKVENRHWLYNRVMAEIQDLEQNLIDCGLLAALQNAGGNKHPAIEPLSQGIRQHSDQLLKRLSTLKKTGV